MEVKIKKARAEDATEILAVQKRAFTIEMQLYGVFDIPPLTETAKDIESEFQDPLFLKAVVDGQFAGSVRARLEDGTCYVGRLAVDPEVQDLGVGTRLMSEVEKHFPAARRFELFTGDRSAKNIHIYEKLGYRTTDKKEVAPDIYLLYMAKDVQRPEQKTHTGDREVPGASNHE